MFEEVVDLCTDGFVEGQNYFNDQDKDLEHAGNVIRPIGILLSVLGWWMLFSPIITLLKFIPLVGALLGGIVSLATFIFALVVGGTIACLIFAIAWLVFRPLYGAILLTLTGIGIYFIFFFSK